MLKSERDFHKILLYLSINHPSQYPNFISSDDFSKTYGIKENTLTYYIDEIVDNSIYPIKFFKLKANPDQYYYFQENGKLETMIRAITEDHITEFTYLNKLFSRSLSINDVIDEILDEISDFLLDNGLKESLKEFLQDYINYLAYKTETEKELKGTADKLEGIIWRDMSDILNSNSIKKENQLNQELENINESIKLNPKNFDLYSSKLKILLYFGQYSAILDLLDSMIVIFPKKVKGLRIKKAYILKRMLKLQDGLAIINDMLLLYPDDTELLNYKAYWLQYLNKRKEAFETIVNLIERDSNNATYHDTYGEILMYFEMYNDASKQFQEVISLASNEWYINQTYIKLGICYMEIGNQEKAIEHLKKGKELTESMSIDFDTKQKWQGIADIFIKDIESS
ncbi:MAG: tetratricopeptide repeat protein, partial [Promethearchaeota archaeon]|jgi:tetratricopeptide (TPR) repeat protein